MTIGERIKKRRTEIGMTVDELALIIGKNRATIYRYESDNIEKLPVTILEPIAKALRISPGELFGWDKTTGEKLADTDRTTIPGIMPLPKTAKKPRLGKIACGVPILAVENFEGYDNVPDTISCDFTLVCQGDSMINARINDGDVVYIKQQSIVENGQIAAVLIDDEEVTLKRIYMDNESIVLSPENPKYPPKTFIKENMNRVKIIGRATGFSSVLA